jgi:hypothetical protein
LAAGFYAGSKWKVSKVYISKDPGHPLYFLSALIAVFLVIFAFAANEATSQLDVHERLCQLAAHLIKPLVKTDELIRLTQLSLMTTWVVLASFIVPRLLNWPLNSNGALLDQIAEKYGEREAIDDVVRDALRLQIPLAITLDDSKVYIGFPISGEPFGLASKRWFRLRPMLSGYRDVKRELQLTTDYQAVISSLRGVDGDDSTAERAFDVVVPFDRMISAHPFDLESYSNYFIGSEWGDAEQQVRLQQLSEFARESAPNKLHSRDYWAFAILLGLSPFVLLAASWLVALLILLLAMSFGIQAAHPISETEDAVAD